ncbi:hypothetical protein Mal52_20870 [Symmachiella dynata]|uniref:Uncharacterized protein n=1 Tax=Symmachiella dynata TaxID=2527995 RepID=A0A517ZMB8_9PLAN|nr:hypothetical protein [Symmachiella dynata]QDU43611.1 hypothetical protein Mal52_20870 [Symmachiella dynata]
MTGAEVLPTPAICEIEFRECQLEHYGIRETLKGLVAFRLLVKLLCGGVAASVEV